MKYFPIKVRICYGTLGNNQLGRVLRGSGQLGRGGGGSGDEDDEEGEGDVDEINNTMRKNFLRFRYPGTINSISLNYLKGSELLMYKTRVVETTVF